jgi:ribose transport system substrate-binding protein
MMNNIPNPVIALTLIASVLVAGCRPQSSGAKVDPVASPQANAAPATQRLVVFSQCNNAEPYRAAQNDEMQRLWAAQPDVKLVIMDAQQDSAKQIGQIETSIRLGPSLLIVAPNERAPLTEVMGKAIAAGIPVICLERDIAQPNYTTWIRADNEAIGTLVGEFVVGQLKAKYGEPRGRIVELAGLKGVEAEINRKGGADAVWKHYPGIEIVTEAVANWLQSTAKDRMTEILSAVPQIDVVYARNDPMAMGAYLAAREKGREKEMIFVGVDGLAGDAGGIEKVRQGILAATFVYPLCVDKAVEIGTRILHEPGFKPDKVYTMTSHIVTRETLAQ